MITLTQLLARIAALGAVGALLFAAVLAPSSGHQLGAPALRAARAASRWAAVWVAATVLSGLLTLSHIADAPLAVLTWSSLLTFVTGLGQGRAAVVVVALAGIVALTARRCTGTFAAAALLATALAAVLAPVVLAGHAATADDHTLAVGSLAVHVVAAALWAGGLLALVLHGRRSGLLASAASRFSALALACFVAAGASGVMGAWVLLGSRPEALASAPGTGYAWLLAGKSAALLSLGALGWHHRRRTLPLLRAGRPRSFVRFALVEAGVMLAAVVLAVTLSASPPPKASVAAPPVAPSPGAAPAAQPSTDMRGHDHGELSVGVLVDGSRFHVAGPVAAGEPVTVYNASTTDVTITATDGSFDTVVRGQTFVTFRAPAAPGDYPFTSRHSAAHSDVLVVR